LIGLMKNSLEQKFQKLLDGIDRVGPGCGASEGGDEVSGC